MLRASVRYYYSKLLESLEPEEMMALNKGLGKMKANTMKEILNEK